jgi:hypothetical protein
LNAWLFIISIPAAALTSHARRPAPFAPEIPGEKPVGKGQVLILERAASGASTLNFHQSSDLTLLPKPRFNPTTPTDSLLFIGGLMAAAS